MTVSEIGTAPDAGWDDFVRGHPDGTVFHLSAWKRAVERAFGHRCHYLAVRRDGEIRGVLPLVHIKSALFGNGLISNGFCVYGGPLAADAEALTQLDDAAGELLSRLGADYLEYRCRRPQHPDWTVKDQLYCTFRKPIEADDDANLKAIPRKQRAVVRKGVKGGLTSVVDAGTDRLFRLYAESVRNLGTPVFPAKWFRILAEEFGENCEVVTVLDGGVPASAVLSLYFRDEVLPFYGGGSAAARGVGANDFMYWEVMRRAARRGARLFDFGRSKVGTGAFQFKKHWGFDPEPLYYEYRLGRASSIPDVNPLNPKYRMMIAVWRRLPLSVANRLGPVLARNLG